MMKQNTITAVSYSRISTWRWCPAQLRFGTIMGIKQPATPAMDEGNRVHKLLETYVGHRGKVPPKLNPGFKPLQPELLKIRKDAGRRVEGQYAFNAKWDQCEYFAPEVRWRMKIDLRYSPEKGVIRLMDYKTGKVKPERDEEQLELYVLTELLTAHQPTGTLETALWYTSHEEEPRVMHVYEAPYDKLQKKLKKYWEGEARQVIEDTRLIATPDEYKCKFCFYSNKRGGPCKAAKA